MTPNCGILTTDFTTRKESFIMSYKKILTIQDISCVGQCSLTVALPILSACGIDPEEYSGFAFGIGLDRLTTTRYKISDIRLLFENDLRFLDQF